MEGTSHHTLVESIFQYHGIQTTIFVYYLVKINFINKFQRSRLLLRLLQVQNQLVMYFEFGGGGDRDIDR